MTIVRELVTKLSFQVDRRGIESFNRSIVGFKTKFAIATTAVTGFVTGVLKAVSSISDAVIDTTQLAKNIGIATDELVGLQKTARQFQIPEDQFNLGIKNLSDSIREARNGFGSLQRLARDGVFEIRSGDGSLLEAQEILLNIVDSLRKVEKGTDRRDLAKQIFGNERFANLANVSREELIRLTESFKPLGTALANAEENALKFDRSFSNLKDNVSEFTLNVAPPFINAVAGVISVLNDAFIKSRERGFVTNLLEGTGITGEIEKTKSLFGGVAQFVESFLGTDSAKSPFSIPQNIDIRNDINITVPPGTEESQAQFIKQGVDEAVRKSFENGFEEIGNNFPETE